MAEKTAEAMTLSLALRVPGHEDEHDLQVTLGENIGGAHHDVYRVASVSPPDALGRLGVPDGMALVLKEGIESATLTGRREAGLEAVRRISAEDPHAMAGVVPLYAMGTGMADDPFAKYGKHLQILDAVFAYDLMPYAGLSLSDIIRKHTTSFWGAGGPAAAVAAMLPSARSLAAIFTLEAHKDDPFGELAAHRDIKPSNIFVLPPGSEEFGQALSGLPFWPDMPLVRIGDFGLLYFSSKDPSATSTNNRPKSGYWSAPEDWSDSFDRKNPQNLDTWAYAATLFFALTGQHPWAAVEQGIPKRMPATEAVLRMTITPTPDSPLFSSLDPRMAAAIQGCLMPADERAPLSELISVMELFAAGELEAARQRAWNGRMAKELAKERDLASQGAIAAERKAQDAIARAEARARAEGDDRVRAERRAREEAVRQAEERMKALWLNESLLRSNTEEQLRAEQRERAGETARAGRELAEAVEEARSEERRRAEEEIGDAVSRAEAEKQAQAEELARVRTRANASEQALWDLEDAAKETPPRPSSGVAVGLAVLFGAVILFATAWVGSAALQAGAPLARIRDGIIMVTNYFGATTGTARLSQLSRDGYLERDHGVFIKTTRAECKPGSGTCYTADIVEILPTDSKNPPAPGAANPNGSCPHGIWISAALVDKDDKVLETTTLVQPGLSPAKSVTSTLAFHSPAAEGNTLQYALAQCIP